MNKRLIIDLIVRLDLYIYSTFKIVYTPHVWFLRLSPRKLLLLLFDSEVISQAGHFAQHVRFFLCNVQSIQVRYNRNSDIITDSLPDGYGIPKSAGSLLMEFWEWLWSIDVAGISTFLCLDSVKGCACCPMPAMGTGRTPLVLSPEEPLVWWIMSAMVIFSKQVVLIYISWKKVCKTTI